MKILLSCLCLLLADVAFSQECSVVVTSGGGFTGMSIVYRITPDGKVLKGKGLGQVTFSEQGKLRKSVARKYYRKTRKLVETNSAFNHPGNMYYSLAAKENESEMKVTWGDAQYPAPAEVKLLFDEIIKTLNGLSFTASTSP